MRIRIVFSLLLSAPVLLATMAAQKTPAPVALPEVRVLVMTGGGFHDFTGNPALLLPGVEKHGGFAWTHLKLGGLAQGDVGPEILADPRLPAKFDAILAYTQGELGLTQAQKAGLIAFVQQGGGFVGLHCAADSHPGWNEYANMIGGTFETHPPFQPFQVHLTDEDHPITRNEPPTWDVTDEFYHLKNVVAQKTVLIEGQSPGDGATRPVAWVRRFGLGHVFYTILGHGPQTHADPRYQEMVARALQWSADP